MIYFPFFCFSICAFLIYKKENSLDTGVYLLILFSISSFFSILIDYYDLYSEFGIKVHDLSLASVVTYISLILLSILPFIKISSSKIEGIGKVNTKKFDKLSYFFVFVFVVVVAVNILDLLDVLNGDFQAIRLAIDDENMESKTTVSPILKFGKYIILFFGRSSPIILFFFFYSLAFFNKSVFFNFLLFISSFSPVVSGIILAGRTQIVYWVLTFLLYLIFFRRFLKKKQLFLLLRYGLILSIFLGLYIFLVTFSRWGDEGFLPSLIVYTGQSFINFCYFFDTYVNREIVLDRILPIFSFFSDKPFSLAEYRTLINENSGHNIGIFYSFLGDLIVDLGHLGMVVFVVLFYFTSMFSLRKVRRDHEITFSNFIIFILLVHIPLHGIFYYSYWRLDMFFYLVFSLFLVKYLKIKSTSKI